MPCAIDSKTAAAEQYSLADDLMRGAQEIGAFIGERDERRVYYLLESGGVPAFKMGGRWYARKSKILARIEKLEQEALSDGSMAS